MKTNSDVARAIIKSDYPGDKLGDAEEIAGEVLKFMAIQGMETNAQASSVAAIVRMELRGEVA